MVSVNHMKRIIPILHGLLLLLGLNLFPLRSGCALANAAVDIASILDKIEPDDLEYIAGSGKVNITGTITISDVDSRNIRSASIRIINGYIPDEDVLVFTNQNHITGVWDKSTGILKLSGSASLANYQTALRSIRYENINTVNPSVITRTISFRVFDGLSNSNTVTRNIAIGLSNKAPQLTDIESTQLVYCPNSGTVAVTAALAASDADNSNLVSARIQIITGYVPGNALDFVNQNGITGSWDNTTGTMTLNGEASVADYETALRSIQYENNNSQNPDEGMHAVTFSVNDGIDESNSVTRNIFVNGLVRCILAGTDDICTDHETTVPLLIDFSGTAPWSFVLERDRGSEVNYDNIVQDPFALTVGSGGTYRIKTLSDANCTGDTAGSGYARITLHALPAAVLSGADTICPGDTARFQVDLTGSPPWNIILLHNGNDQVTLGNIFKSPYTLKVTDEGIYSLSALADAHCSGRVSGTAVVTRFDSPSAFLHGNASICEKTSAGIEVALTGTPPWSYSYKRNNESTVSVGNILSNPSILTLNNAGTYTLVEMYDKHCRGTVSGTAIITLIPTPEVTITGLAPAYDKEDTQLVPISGSPAGGNFSGPGIFFSDPLWYFLPRYAPAGVQHIVYEYQESPGTCKGYDTVIVKVLEANAVIEFPEDRTNYCQNESPFTISGVNTANSTGSFSITGNTGLVDNHNNTATILPSLLGSKEYSIVYTYTDGIPLSITRKLDIRIPPVADFQWESECYTAGEPIRFNNTSPTTFGTITGSIWKISAQAGIDTAITHDIVYSFREPGNYNIELQIQTAFGCTDTVAKTFILRPYYHLADSIYFEDFESPLLNWKSGTSSTPAVNSWELGDPSRDFSGISPGTHCWYTQIPSSGSPLEQSWVTSPCFDFTGAFRPMLKLKIWRLFDSNRDGANLQFTADSGKTWTLLGLIGDGINWYNHYNILGNPGKYAMGWANIQDDKWYEARHSLDLLKGEKVVQFRLAYGSDGTAINNHGIAMDDLWIGNQNRTVLLEHFTNASDALSKEANLAVNNLVHYDSLGIIDLQYHTSFPGKDPFNEQEPYVPGTRVLYYGLSDVPCTILNGGSKPAQRFDYHAFPLNNNSVLTESLLESKFNITIKSWLKGNSLNIQTQVSARENISTCEFTVHIAVIERRIRGVSGNNGESEFENVVKALLPDAAGTSFFKSWIKGETITIEESWEPRNIYDPKELRLVAFIQDEATSEIYEAAMHPLDILTGTDAFPPGASPSLFIVFPNPASDWVVVQFENPLAGDTGIEIFNSMGVLVYHCRMLRGTGETEIGTGEFPEGFYTIRILSDDQVLGSRKLTIIR
jgi:hypothetical protein